MGRSRRKLCLFASAIWGLFAWSLAGCGGPLPDATPVSGTVSYQGSALEGATVTFHNESEEGMAGGGLAMGTTDSQGKFTLQSHLGPTDVANGVVPGEYRVTISKFIPPKGMSEQDYDKLRAEETKIMESEGVVPPDKQTPPKVELLPATYSDARTTTLQATVPEGGDEGLKFELK